MSKIEDTSNELPPWLSDLKQKGDGLRLPKDYFESFEQKILEQTGGQERFQTTTGLRVAAVNKRGFFRLSYQLAAAAAIVGILVAAWWLFQPKTPSPAYDLSGDDLHAYILENAQEFDVEQLASIEPEHPIVHQEEENGMLNQSKPNDNKQSEELRPEDLEHLLDDLSDEELQEIL